MALYSAGRRRTMLILLLTSILLITLDARGNEVFNAVRTAFSYAQQPFEIAGEVIARPVSRAWDGISRVDDLERENAELRSEIDRQRAEQISAKAAIEENAELRGLLDLDAVGALPSIQCSVIGLKPNNFDQRVEIDCGSSHGLEPGMAVVSAQGLVGKVTKVNLTDSVVMLITDSEYAVHVKVVGEDGPDGPDDDTATSVPPTLPNGEPIEPTTEDVSSDEVSSDDVSSDDVSSDDVSTDEPTTDEPTTDEPTTDEPTSDEPATDDLSTDEPTADDGAATSAPSTPTTTVTPTKITRETGVLQGFGPDRLPKVGFIADSPLFGLPEIGDAVLTAGGSDSNAPPDIPIGRVINVIDDDGVAGLRLEIQPSSDLARLNFVKVILYLSPREAGNLSN